MEQDGFPGFGYVVIELGSRYTKCGFGGETAPRAVFQNPFKLSQLLTCTHNHRSDLSLCWDSNPDRNSELDPSGPIYQIALKKELFFHFEHIFFDKLFCAPKGLNVVILTNILSPIFKNNLKPVVKSLLMQHFQAKKVTFMTTQEVSVLGSGLKDVSGLVIDCGFSETRIVPICFGIPDIHAIKIIPLGSFHLMQKLAQEILDTNPFLNHHLQNISIDIFEDILSRICFFDNTTPPDFDGNINLDLFDKKFKSGKRFSSKKKFKCWKTSEKIAGTIKYFDNLFTPPMPPHFLSSSNNLQLKFLYPITPASPRSPSHSRSSSSNSFPTLTSPKNSPIPPPLQLGSITPNSKIHFLASGGSTTPNRGSSSNLLASGGITPPNRGSSNNLLSLGSPAGIQQQQQQSPALLSPRKSSLTSSGATPNFLTGSFASGTPILTLNDPTFQKRRHTTTASPATEGNHTPRQEIGVAPIQTPPQQPQLQAPLGFPSSFVKNTFFGSKGTMIYRWKNNEITISKQIREKLLNDVFFSTEPEKEEDNIAFAVLDTILNCDIIKRQHVCSNIVVCGGTAMTFGFTQRLFQIMHLAIQNLGKYKILRQSTKNFQKSKLNCSENSIGWLGGSIFAVGLQTTTPKETALHLEFNTPKTPNTPRTNINFSNLNLNVDLNLSFSPIPSPSSRLKQLSANGTGLFLGLDTQNSPTK